MTPADTVGIQLEQLPRGRHGLSPQAVTESQRGRILTAMVEVTAERGYADCRIADVIAYAGIPLKTDSGEAGQETRCGAGGIEHISISSQPRLPTAWHSAHGR